MRIVVKLCMVVFAGSLGCIAQSGDPNEQTSSSSEPLGATGATVPRQEQAERPAQLQQQQKPVQLQLGGKVKVGAPTANGGDPSQDDGDGTEPDPHPWEPHTSSGTTTARQR